MWYTPTTKYHSALKRKATPMHATTWTGPEDISEISQLQKGKSYMILLLSYLE